MSMLTRSLTLGMLALGLGAGTGAAQQKPKASGDFKWYVGAQLGIFAYKTASQTRGAQPSVGGNMLITARRTGLLIQVDEMIKSNQLASYADATAPNGIRNVLFNDVRRYQATLVGFPVRAPAEPYFGVGGGIMQVVKKYPQNTAGLTPDEIAAIQAETDDRSTYAYASVLAGLQFRGGPASIFGQAELTTGPNAGSKLLEGGTWILTAGARFSLGSARDKDER